MATSLQDKRLRVLVSYFDIDSWLDRHHMEKIVCFFAMKGLTRMVCHHWINVGFRRLWKSRMGIWTNHIVHRRSNQTFALASCITLLWTAECCLHHALVPWISFTSKSFNYICIRSIWVFSSSLSIFLIWLSIPLDLYVDWFGNFSIIVSGCIWCSSRTKWS